MADDVKNVETVGKDVDKVKGKDLDILPYLPIGFIVSGFFTGGDSRISVNRETGERRTIYVWGVAYGTKAVEIYVTKSVYRAVKPVPMSNIALKIRPFPVGRGVSGSLIGLAATLYDGDGGKFTPELFEQLFMETGDDD